MNTDMCPCGSGKKLDVCCGPFIHGTRRPETALQLMRSRYTAYVIRNIDYLKETLWPAYQSGFDAFSTTKWASENHWTGLEILETEAGGVKDREGTVLFEARFLAGGQLLTHRELSRFRRKSGRWYYVEALPGTA